MKPVIQWFVKEEDAYVPRQEYYTGTYTQEEQVKTDMRIWNNRWGTKDVEDLENATLKFYFDTLEDSSLMDFCSIVVGGYSHIKPEVVNQKGYIHFNKDLSGKANDGSAENEDNYIDISFRFDAGSQRLKNNDLKNLYFEIIASVD